MELEFRHLRIVCMIADCGSVTKASARARLSQPAMTHQLQRIERVIGGQLFVRGRTGARLTPLGELVVSRARALLPALDDLIGDIRRQPGGSMTLVRFGTQSSPLSTTVFEAVRSRLPDTDVAMHVQQRPGRALELLAVRRLELAMLTEYPTIPLPRPAGVSVTVVAELPVFVALPAVHRLAARAEIDLIELAGEDWILLAEPDQACAESLRLACAGAGFEPQISHQLNRELADDALGRGHGITIARPGRPDTERVAVRPLRGAPMVFRDLLAWPDDGVVAPLGPDLVAAAADAGRQAIEDVPAHRSWLSACGWEIGETAVRAPA